MRRHGGLGLAGALNGACVAWFAYFVISGHYLPLFFQEDHRLNVDSAGVKWLNELANRSETLRQLVVWLATDMEAVLLVTLVVGWLLLVIFEVRTRRRLPWRFIEMGIAVCLALAVGLAANQLIGHLWFRDRPYASLTDVHLLLSPSSDPSFPSDHATGALALTLVVLSLEPVLGGLLAFEAALLMFGRVAAALTIPVTCSVVHLQPWREWP